jgi:hypothetical protein
MRNIADKAAVEGLTPLEIVLSIMRQRYAAKDYDGALEAAIPALAHCHPRMGVIEPQTCPQAPNPGGRNVTLKLTVEEFGALPMEEQIRILTSPLPLSLPASH